MDTLFSNATVVTMDESKHQYTGGYVGIPDGKISYVGKIPPPETEKPEKIIDGTGMVLMPGLINCHTHLPMTILRGYADDYDLQTWLTEHIFPKEARLDDRCVKAATLLGIAECLQFGVTSVTDMYDHIDAIAEAVAESGIKANLSRGTTLFDPENFEFDKYPACQELVAARDPDITEESGEGYTLYTQETEGDYGVVVRDGTNILYVYCPQYDTTWMKWFLNDLGYLSDY